jgi:hypothetical protein
MRTQRLFAFSTKISCVLLVLLLLTACQSAEEPQSADEPVDSGIHLVSAGSVDQPDSGAMDLTAGLNELDSYQATYSKTVQGTLNGSPYETSTKITRTAILSQPAEDSTIDSFGADGARVYLHYIRLEDRYYYQNGADQPCKGAMDVEPAGFVGHPAAMLPRVTDPQPAGGETVNGIETTRYELTAAALGSNPEKGRVSGSLWIANQGGFVVKYSLQYDPLAATGQGLEASQTIEYQISQVNQIAPIELPSNCIPILADVPAMPVATELERRSGLMSYYTASEQTDVAAFYIAELAPLGWQIDEREEGDPEAGLSYSKDGHLLKILLDARDEGLLVSVLHSNPEHLTPLPPGDLSDFELPEDTSNPDATSPPEPTLDPVQLGLPPDVPLYPGARNVQSMSGMGASFITGDSVEQVIQFYTEMLTQAGWQSTPMPSQAGEMMIWMKGNAMLNLSVQSSGDGSTQISIMAISE